MGTHNDLTPIKSRIVGYDTKPADQFNAHPHNWRKHPQRQREAVAASLRELGWIAPVIENRQTGNLIDGHERVWQALQRGEDVPYMLVDLSPEDEVLALATFDAITNMAETDAEALDRLLAEVSTGEAALMELIAETAADAGLFDITGNKGVAMSSERPTTPIDLIWTTGVACCMAVKMGWEYGIQSTGSVCNNASATGPHKVVFVDNDYQKYNHGKHIEVVSRYSPRYATTRDIMTKSQCDKAGITYYPLEQILDWAEELSEYAQNVIIIPKYDCLDQIPDKFMLGYSVPTSYGGTPLPIESFSGRRVHLLGGNPDNQIECCNRLGKWVVSLDANQMALKAEFGNTWTPSGYRRLQDINGYENVNTAWGLYPSVILSLVSFSSWFAGSAIPAQ